MSKKLKQRTVGLLVLGALTAIVVPILLDISQSNQSGTIVSPIPEKPDGFIIKRLSLDEPQQSVILDDDTSKLIKAPDISNPTQVVESQKQLDSLPVEFQPETSKAVKEVKKSVKKPNAWVVQLASFSSKKNALALRNKLQKSGYRAFIERIDTTTGKRFRVKVGPELSKKTSNNLQVNLMDEFRMKGVVVKHRAGTSVVTTGE
ncbi:MAG: SPOR domain-containing protein [Gammaproteobacteria bacterium]|nr:SPOR domain-containing protein [Gammaproteobacteria bacterium]